MSENYPRNDVCAECGGQIVIHLSKKDTEYACNSDTRNDFHKPCRNWKAKESQTQSREEADIEQSTTARARTTEPDPEAPKSSFEIKEITATVNRKVGDSTIRGLAAYENLDFRATLRAELFRGADVQQVFRELYAEGHKAIDKQIRETQAKFSK